MKTIFTFCFLAFSATVFLTEAAIVLKKGKKFCSVHG